MRVLSTFIAAVVCGAALTATVSPQVQPAQPAGGTDIYHVNFSKAVPGEAAALGQALSVPDKTAPMPEHFVVLRHQEGDDWDYMVIQHLGPKVAFDAAPTPPGPAFKLRAWHNDTFVSGPSWGEFTKAMGLGESGAASAVYIVGVHRPLPGHREDLVKALTQAGPAASKVQTGDLLFQHLEGADWSFLSLTRYNSWQDLATDRAAAAAAGDQGGWAEIRRHSAFHRDTIVDRVYPK